MTSILLCQKIKTCSETPCGLVSFLFVSSKYKKLETPINKCGFLNCLEGVYLDQVVVHQPKKAMNFMEHHLRSPSHTCILPLKGPIQTWSCLELISKCLYMYKYTLFTGPWNSDFPLKGPASHAKPGSMIPMAASAGSTYLGACSSSAA